MKTPGYNLEMPADVLALQLYEFTAYRAGRVSNIYRKIYEKGEE